MKKDIDLIYEAYESGKVKLISYNREVEVNQREINDNILMKYKDMLYRAYQIFFIEDKKAYLEKTYLFKNIRPGREDEEGDLFFDVDGDEYGLRKYILNIKDKDSHIYLMASKQAKIHIHENKDTVIALLDFLVNFDEKNRKLAEYNMKGDSQKHFGDIIGGLSN